MLNMVVGMTNVLGAALENATALLGPGEGAAQSVGSSQDSGMIGTVAVAAGIAGIAFCCAAYCIERYCCRRQGTRIESTHYVVTPLLAVEIEEGMHRLNESMQHPPEYADLPERSTSGSPTSQADSYDSSEEPPV